MYIYHIVTSVDIEAEINKSLKPYPIVHRKGENETCICYQDTSNEEGQNDGEGRDTIDNGLGGVSNEDVQKLCPGPNGTIDAADGGGKSSVRWRNGRTRRYSFGRGSYDFDENGDGSMGRISSVGTFITEDDNAIRGVYTGPFKFVAVHYGTRRRHWHVIYVSNNRQWGFNSRLGKLIRTGQYKNRSVGCLTCIRQYLYSGDGRQVLQDVLTEKHFKIAQCAEHKCGLDGDDIWQKATYQIDCAERGNSILNNEIESFEKRNDRMVDAIIQTNDDNNSGSNGGNRHEICDETRKILGGRKTSVSGDNGYNGGEIDCDNSRNSNIIIVLCKHGAFTESEAMGIFAKSNEGINFICTKQYAEKIRTYIGIARILVFQESVKQRFERAKLKFEINNKHLMNEDYQEECRLKLIDILERNKINVEKFFIYTFEHFTRRTKKRNNLFFVGPPSTGKTMIMSSLVECHFNYCRLTGLIPNSSFNFSGLIHTNACFMDECKLTENQLEQWKLLASGLPMSTDVKYKDRCDVKDCVLYTCSNYNIAMYCNAPMADEAVNERTITFQIREKCPYFVNISPHVWEKCWLRYNCQI